MKILQYLQYAWMVATVCALSVVVYNLVTLQTFDYRVYFPLFCALFCILIWYNIRGQRRFRDKVMQENKKRK